MSPYYRIQKHRIQKRRSGIVFIARLVLCLSMILPHIPLTAHAAVEPTTILSTTLLSTPQKATIEATASTAPALQVACPAGPSGLPDFIDRAEFCVRYNDANTTDAQATTVADLTQQYWDRYDDELGFRTPLFSGKLVVEVRNNAACNGATDAGVNWMFVNNGCFAPNGAINQATGHELFHRVQLASADDLTAGFWLFEGTARLMEDLAFDNIDNWVNSMAAAFSFNQQVNTYLGNTNVDLTSNPQRYNSALWWKFFTEQYGSDPDEPELGVDAIAELWDAAVTKDDIAAVDLALTNLGSSDDFKEAFRRFTVANWTKDLSNLPDPSFNYVDEEQAGNPAPYGPINPDDGGVIQPGSPMIRTNQAISRFGASYYAATPGDKCPVVNATFHTDSGPAFFHVVTEKGGALESHYESSSTDWSRSFYNDGLTRIVAVAGSTDNSAQVDITMQCLNPNIDIKLPNNVAVARVGSHDGAGKFLAQVLVTDGSPNGPVISGLTVNDFKATVGSENALVTAGGFIQEQYWLVIQAPNQAADGIYNLEIKLEEPNSTTAVASDINANSIVYTPENVDHLLVVDRSGSMSSDGKMDAAIDAANFYVDITRNNDGISVVPFNHDVDPTPFDLQSVDITVRTGAKNFNNALFPGGATSIGDGMAEAVNQRNSSPTGNPFCSYVLLSDGMENSSVFWADVQADVIATGCPVTTIAFGAGADETLMQDIATATGGSFFFNDVFVSSAVDAASVNSASAADASNANLAASTADSALALASTYEYAQALGEGRQRLLDQRGVVPATSAGGNSERQHSVLIDDSVEEALFALNWARGGCQEFCPALTMRLVAPDGSTYTEKDHPFTFKNNYNGHLGWRIPNPQPGRWTIFVNHADPRFEWGAVTYRMMVSGHSNLNVELLLPDRLGSRYFTGNRVPIFALLSSDGPIGDALVVAIVTAPDGTQTSVPLYDDGQHDDGAPGDGFYAGIYERVNQATPVSTKEDGEKPTAPKDEGSYRVRLLAGTGEIQREALGSFSVLESPDTNENGIPDTYEKENGLTNPNGDNDLDGLSNGDEYKLGTDPNDSDTDDGGENDGSEVEKEKTPFNPKDDSIREPSFFDAKSGENSVQLRYDVHPDYSYMILFRSEKASGPWSLRDVEVKPTGNYVDKEVKNGVPYYYRLMAVNENVNRSAVVASAAAVPSEDPFLPEAKILINKGIGKTDKLDVLLDFVPYEEPAYYEDIVEVKVGNEPDLGKADWQPFKPQMEWALAETDSGEWARVYARFRDKAGNESLLETASILFELPEVEPDPNTGAEKIDDIPIEFHRRAAQFLEEMRGNPMAPGWEKAQLSMLVRKLYRPDVEGTAYYEFQILDGEGGEAGFIILSTGDHDYPIAHWNFEGETPTQNVEREAAKNGKKVAKFYKLDALAYAGEDANGDLVALPGTQMVKISGMEMSMLDQEMELSGAEWIPNQETKNDDDAQEIDGKITETGPKPLEQIKLDGWESWQALKAGFKDSYGVMAEALRREAAQDWEVDKLSVKYGEGLLKGETYSLTLLYNDAPKIELSGKGSDTKYLDAKIITGNGQPAILRLHVKDAEPGVELPLNIALDYGATDAKNSANAATASSVRATRAEKELIKFALLDPGSLPKEGSFGDDGQEIFLPLIAKDQGGVVSSAVLAPQAIDGSWSSWTYYWAGSHSNQRLYSQIPSSHAINTSSCWSGCGGTAWAMLFGWADKQAALGNSYWSPRWGLYRQNGGKGSNAVAPSTMDDGVRNMTWEIRNDVGTWCAFGSGPTNPWDMDEASEYFKGRTGTKLSTHYNVLGIQEGRLREYARNSIRDRNTPAIIGTGWLTHYPLAYGYAWRKRRVRKCFIFCWNETQYNRSFYVNQGWGGSGNGWVSAGTWFAGEIRP